MSRHTNDLFLSVDGGDCSMKHVSDSKTILFAWSELQYGTAYVFCCLKSAVLDPVSTSESSAVCQYLKKKRLF